MSETHHPNYKKIYGVLLVLLFISVAGPFIGIKWVTLITAFGIALVKARLVVANFMHLKWEKQVMKIMLAGSLLLMFLLFTAVAPDVMEHHGTNWNNDAAQAATRRGIPAPHEGGPAAEHQAAAAPHESTTTVAAAPAAAGFDAHAAFTTICASCHGAGGRGDGAAGMALNPKPANFTSASFWAGKTDAELVKAIREGGASVGRSAAMPAWGSLYNEDQAKALVAYLKTLRQ